MSDEQPKHTPGPWRWEVNLKHRDIHLCGGSNPFDLTVIDFVRWGMGNAAPRFRTGPEHMNIMKRCEHFSEIVPGREHHAEWFQAINHPDAKLIAAAPEMLAILVDLKDAGLCWDEWNIPLTMGQRIDDVIRKATT